MIHEDGTMPPITLTLLWVPLRAFCGLVDPIARLKRGYGGADGWSAADEQKLSSTFFHFCKSRTQPIWSTIIQFGSTSCTRAAFPQRCKWGAHVFLPLADVPKRCGKGVYASTCWGSLLCLYFAMMLLQTNQCLFCYFLFSDTLSSSKRNNGIFNSPRYGQGEEYTTPR